MMKLSSLCSIGAVSAVSLITMGISAPVHAVGFTGEFAPVAFTSRNFLTTDPNVDLSNSDSQRLVNLPFNPDVDETDIGLLSITTRATPTDTTSSFSWLKTLAATNSPFYIISFEWNAISNDSLFYRVGNTDTQLTGISSQPISFLLSSANTQGFGFVVQNTTSGANSSFTISNFNAVGVPWETDALPVLGTTILFGAGVWAKQKFTRVKFQK